MRYSQRTRSGLASHGGNRFGGRADPDQASLAYRAGKPFALGEEAVSGMNCLRSGLLCRFDDFVTAKVALA